MAVSRRGGRSRTTLAILALASVTLITIDVRADGGALGFLRSAALETGSRISGAVRVVTEPVADLFGSMVHQDDLEDENARLRDALAEARVDAARAADLERERDALLTLLGLEWADDIPSVAARVTTADASNAQQVIEIDRGTDHGVSEGLPVVAGGGLIGRVVRVSPTRALVLLVTDPTFTVGVRLTGSGEVGVANGTGRDADLDVDLIAAATVVAVDELVVTSGLEQSRYPPGIPVGTVSKDELPESGLERDVRLAPTVDLQRLHFVRVLQWSPRFTPAPQLDAEAAP